MRNGFTLLELMMTMTVSSILLVGMLAFFSPAMAAFTAAQSDEEMRVEVSSTLDFLENEIASMKGVYVDDNLCYKLCMTDGNNNRIYYYWKDGNKLYRKQESTAGPIACTGGKTLSTGLDPTLTQFSSSRNLLNATIGAKGNNDQQQFQLTNTLLPSLRERDYILYEGFECASLSNGWTITAGSSSTWSITSGSQIGLYEITHTATTNISDTSSISIPIDLSRISTARLRFYYMNSGTISSPNTFTVSFYDGSQWRTVFSDTRAQAIPNFRQVDSDLSGYTLSNTNQLKFTTSLNHTNAHWYIDGISVYVP